MRKDIQEQLVNVIFYVHNRGLLDFNTLKWKINGLPLGAYDFKPDPLRTAVEHLQQAARNARSWAALEAATLTFCESLEGME